MCVGVLFDGLALNCLLWTEQVNFENFDSDDDPLRSVKHSFSFADCLLRRHMLAFGWGAAALFDPVQTIPTTLVAYWIP